MLTIKYYCISLYERQDRRDKITKEFERLGILNDVVWWIVNRHPKGGRYGCFESHVHIWEQNDADIAIIFEDDAIFDGMVQQFNDIINEAITLSNEYDIIMLGTIPCILGEKVSTYFYEGVFITSSCYLASDYRLKTMAKRVRPYYGSHIDVVLSHVASEAGLYKIMFKQNYCDSDNSWLSNTLITRMVPKFEKKLRKKIMDDPYFVLSYPPILIKRFISLIINLNYLQYMLSGKTSPIEYKDRRVY